MSTSLERQIAFQELSPPAATFEIGVAPYFRVQKSRDEIEALLRNNNCWFEAYDPFRTPQAIREQMWEDVTVDDEGFFEFQPDTLVLGHTDKSVEIPEDEDWYMGSHFIDTKSGLLLPLSCHVTAPFLHPGSSGRQTYEIVNESTETLKVKIEDLKCKIDIRKLGTPPEGVRKSIFSHQEEGKIKIGNFSTL